MTCSSLSRVVSMFVAQRGPLHQVHQLGLPDQDDLQ